MDIREEDIDLYSGIPGKSNLFFNEISLFGLLSTWVKRILLRTWDSSIKEKRFKDINNQLREGIKIIIHDNET